MEASPYSSKTSEGSEFSLKEWELKAQRRGERTTKSRRYSASYIRSFNDETRSFRSSHISFSSAASSPAYPFKDGIDPSTYSFNTAIRALQVRSCLSPDGLALNSKWNEAERYICNPLSGEVPLECLSTKALISSGRSFRKSTNRVITMFDNPTAYSSRNPQTKTSSTDTREEEEEEEDDDEVLQSSVSEKKKEGKTRDVGTQSTLPYLSSSSPSPASTPSITDRSIKELADSPSSNAKSKPDQEVPVEEKDKDKEMEKSHELGEQVDQLYRQSGCFPWIKKKKRLKDKEKGKHIRICIFITKCQRKQSVKC